MKAVIQRVAQASVAIDGSVHGAIGRGFLVLVGIRDDDTPETVRKMAEKIVRLRVFDDEKGKMNRNLEAVGGKILSISQFTLFADCSRGNRPSFTGAAVPEEGRRLYEYFVDRARQMHPLVQTGEFGAMMQVSLTNDGPVTFWLRVPPAGNA